VTRDDINQLRSFPNPPLPAVKVVESLCFVFNEDQLIKEKVGENGTKFKDYWEYAKKFILNDRLLKRVTEFKPDYIKNLNKNKMNILKVLIRQ
jgi:dynein heavy chain